MQLAVIGKFFSHVSGTAMDRLRETIHENEILNQVADRVCSYTLHFFLSRQNLEMTSHARAFSLEKNI